MNKWRKNRDIIGTSHTEDGKKKNLIRQNRSLCLSPDGQVASFCILPGLPAKPTRPGGQLAAVVEAAL